jgi:hypothetical protein
MTIEIWKAIPNYQGYEVSNNGRIRTVDKVTYSGGRVRHWKNRMMKLKTDKNGYKRVALWSDGKQKDWLIHRLVADAFLPKKDGLDIVNHIDCDTGNNNVSNLEWTDYSGNLQHAYEHGLNQEPKQIVLIRMTDKSIYHFISYSKASQFLNKNNGYISSVLKKGKSEADGYKIYTPPF